MRTRNAMSTGRRRGNAKRASLGIESLEPRQLLASDVVINEIHYDPPDKTQRAEFIELFNNSDRTIDVSGWHFSAGVNYTFPDGTKLGAGDYLVAAEEPVTVRALFGIEALGPWNGTLRNSGDRVELRDAVGNVIDEVDYQRGFPWPTIGDAPGKSIELMHPDLANDLGGNWRSAGTSDVATPMLLTLGSTWKYLPGTQEASSPRSAWRTVDFDDSHWNEGTAAIGYGDPHVVTNLAMRNNYSTVYLRKTVEIDDVTLISKLTLRAQYDDGFNLWINGQHVAGANVPGRSLAYNATANSALENLALVEFALPAPSSFLVEGTNIISVQLFNASLGGSSDAWFDAELVVSSGDNASPGAANTVLRNNAAPAARRVSHGDGQVKSGQDVPINIKATDNDGIQSVTLQYQVVAPGDYFGRYLKADANGTPMLNPRYDNPNEWTTVRMHDDGFEGDAVAQDDVFTIVIPGHINQHRHLVRYRINVADTKGASVQVPYADDPQHNFAYYVYDGTPKWTASARPGVEPEETYDFDQFHAMATYQLLTTREDHADSQHIPDASTDGYGGSENLWPGTLVYDGQVYDNIRYRARGGVWRYAMGKNMWKFDFNRGHGFQAKDDYGREYNENWDKLNLSALIQQGNYLHRGEQGLFESVGFKLFNLAGVASSFTNYVHFRVIDSPQEQGPDQFSGDFQGLYLAVEQPDGRMLDEHHLPDGNLYKIENHRGTSNNQGPTQVSDGSDVATFINGYRDTTPTPEWWAANLDLEKYYSYRAIVEGIHHYDIAYGKNYLYYHNPDTDKFEILPWDLDLTWANNMFGSGEHDFVIKVARNDAFAVDYQNRLREITDLLFNPEQTGLLIDEFAALVDAAGTPSWVDADRALWDYNPILVSSYVNPSKAGHGRFYERSATHDFAGMVQLMKDYVDTRLRHLQQLRTTDRFAPETPTLQYVGQPDFPINALAFRSSDFADPQGPQTFAALQWRIAEITDPQNPQLGGDQPPHYEITPTWESGVLDTFQAEWAPPAKELTVGSLYRVRVRMQDTDGHWSHWSDPVQFTAANALASNLAGALRISELHYHPAVPTEAEKQAGFADADDFEFIELVNIGGQTIQLNDTSLTKVEVDGDEQGIHFDFSTGQITELAPGERLLVVENPVAFGFRYGDGFPIAGEWDGKLSNGGERLTLVDNGAVIVEFTYDDAWHPSSDGEGFSLEVVDPRSADAQLWSRPEGWVPSWDIGGSPDASRIRGDFDGDLVATSRDIDLLFGAIRDPSPALRHDVNDDRRVDATDVDVLVRDVLHTYYGDADLDGEVSFVDFLALAGSFGHSRRSWSQGDFSGDGEVSFADYLILADYFGRTRAGPQI